MNPAILPASVGSNLLNFALKLILSHPACVEGSGKLILTPFMRILMIAYSCRYVYIFFFFFSFFKIEML